MLPPIARRFVAGETHDGALDRARGLNDRGIGAILNLLGEHYTDPGPAAEDVAAYRDLLAAIDDAGLRACLSVKPSQLGLRVDEPTFRENAAAVVDAAAARDGFVWFDMEDHETTDRTLDAFVELTDRHPGHVGVCLQANLRRTSADLDRLAGRPGKLRLVKGAYDEPADVAYPTHDAVNDAYRRLLEQAFRDHDGGIAVGTHDPAMIDHALALAAEHDVPYEFQLLMGVREAAQERLAGDHDVWQYVPFGRKWRAYFWRRVTERKENVLFALRAIVGR